MSDVKEIAKNNKITKYVISSWHELTKVTWPTKNQAVRLTLVVLGFCLVFAIALAVMDFVFGQGHNYLVKWAATVAPKETVSTDSTGQTPVPVSAGGIQAKTADGKTVDIPINATSTPVKSSTDTK